MGECMLFKVRIAVVKLFALNVLDLCNVISQAL